VAGNNNSYVKQLHGVCITLSMILCSSLPYLKQFPKYQMKIILDFHAEFGRQYIFKPTVGNESLREDSNVMKLE
jgi:hypothetical protein